MINEINRLIEVKNEREGSNDRSSVRVCICATAKRWQTIPTKYIKRMKWHEQRTTMQTSHGSRRIHMLFAAQCTNPRNDLGESVFLRPKRVCVCRSDLVFIVASTCSV